MATPQPSLTPPSTCVVGHEHVVEEDLGEALVAVEAADAAHGDALGVERHEEVGQAAVALGVGIGAEQAEQLQLQNAPRVVQVFWPVSTPAAALVVAHGRGS